ncbi:unnamed protein product [Aphanomyces euteiches]|uniref:Ubiquitin-like protein ATG12 n=1 Tax=Aphanomyces euteiches TaxID=100861 RepID=A0A6G0WMC5_9STRA|nr:hypothetical protein Ae201684_013808 [Aphanomyces euteiches]KAH9080838.1 hypothetical protein Ae201684P_007924 [Aphanomyces euteiches]KAH9099055.1 hypothetical protein LEN26_016372 [Aphanomyces euteiches]KAH9110252.1 hypothetical protein AeMF1_014884 [Aphanomyces euteiches]KAH9143662.1 hypothetical protein AeRB84_012358 [Aphanomyces euteiches]
MADDGNEDSSSSMEQLSINGRPSGPEKVTIQFTAVGGAPIMKRSKFTVNGNDPLSNVYIFLRKQLRLKDEDSLFVYCNNAFAPTPDQRMSELFECFQINGLLVLNYSRTQAWG